MHRFPPLDLGFRRVAADAGQVWDDPQSGAPRKRLPGVLADRAGDCAAKVRVQGLGLDLLGGVNRSAAGFHHRVGLVHVHKK